MNCPTCGGDLALYANTVGWERTGIVGGKLVWSSYEQESETEDDTEWLQCDNGHEFFVVVDYEDGTVILGDARDDS